MVVASMLSFDFSIVGSVSRERSRAFDNQLINAVLI